MPYVPVGARPNRSVVAEAAAEGLWQAASREGGQVLLDMIDLALHDIFPPESALQTKHGELTALLDAILREGGSMWRPTPNGDSLEQRVSDDLHTLLMTTLGQDSPAAGTHLQEAWRSTYGRHPDPSKAYAEAIRAVESAAIPLVTPNDGKATLGTIRGQLRSQAKDFEFAIVPTTIAPVIDAISALWEGQSDRHGLPDGVRPISQESTEAAVALAITLVHWFTSGSVRRR
jgi:hypothetical protein